MTRKKQVGPNERILLRELLVRSLTPREARDHLGYPANSTTLGNVVQTLERMLGKGFVEARFKAGVRTFHITAQGRTAFGNR